MNESTADRLYGCLPNSQLNSVGFHTDINHFKTVGYTARRILIDECGLRPDNCILDIGCGIGRMTIPLLDYLRSPGQYEGFDVTASSIDWCRREISASYPNFSFRQCDIFNTAYHPTGKQRAADFVFPYPDDKFDVALATSVFTHMLRAEVHQYLSEAKRVLKPGGAFLASFFLLDGEARRCIDAKLSSIQFVHEFQPLCWVMDEASPESAVAYDFDHIMETITGFRFRLERRWVGGWSGREVLGEDLYQDFLLLRKEP